MSRIARALVPSLVVLLIAAALPNAFAGDEPIDWYSSAADSGPCESCFEMEFEGAGTDEAVVLSPTLLFVPAETAWKAKPYTPPKWVAGKPNTATWVTTGVIGAGWVYLWADANSTDDNETIKEVGDYTQIIPPAAGLGMAIGAKDKKGLIQYGISFGVSMATVQLFKNSAGRWRPDGTDQHSFPSGHTAGSFFGAGFIYQRYGPKWGVPALVMATYTGFSRVYGQKHFAGDALSGASIAMLSTLAFVTPADPERAAHYADMERHRKWRFEFEMYQSNVTENWVQGPGDTGTLLDFRFDQNSNPTINGAAALDWNVKGRHNIRFRYSPFEQRDVGSVEAGTVFGEYVFPASDIFSIYFLGDLRARYAFDLLPNSRFQVQLGGGVSIQEGEISLYEADLSTDVPEVDTSAGDSLHEFGAAPIVYLRLGVDFSKRFTLYAEGDGFVDSEANAYDAVVKFQYHINSMWDVALGWRASEYELDSTELKNEFAANGWAFHAAYSF